MKKIISIIAVIAGILLVAGEVIPLIIVAAFKTQIPGSIGIIGGADGPTAIFVAGKVGGGNIIGAILAGILLIAAGIYGYRKWGK